MKSAKTLANWKRKYGKVTILGAIFIGGTLAFWLGLRATLRTDIPLLPVDSTSMSPTLNYGDLIIVQGITNACDIEPGDIIVFHGSEVYNSGLIILRATEKTVTDGTCYFRTRGDANPSEAPWEVSDTQIVGRCIGRAPWLGHVPLFLGERVLPFLSSPIGFLTLVLTILGLMLLKHIAWTKKKFKA